MKADFQVTDFAALIGARDNAILPERGVRGCDFCEIGAFTGIDWTARQVVIFHQPKTFAFYSIEFSNFE